MGNAPALIAVAVALAALSFGEFTTAQAVVGFILGIFVGAIIIVAAIIVGLTYAEKKTAAAKQEELRSKSDNILPEAVCDSVG